MTILTLSCSASDCWDSPADGALYTGTNVAYVAGSSFGDDHTRVWIPFVVPLPKIPLISAVLKVVASANGNSADIDFRIAASPEDNASNPTTHAQAAAKSITAANLYPATLPSAVGVEYSYTVTSIIQEILNRAGWVYGNNLGILLDAITVDSTKRCEIAMTEHATYAEPKLVLTFPTFFPKNALVL